MMNEEGMMKPVDSTENPIDMISASIGSTNPVMDYDPAEDEEELTQRLYDSNELAGIFGMSLPRLSQLRIGQTIVKGDRTYVFEPLFQEGVDFTMDGTKVLYTQSAYDKLKERKPYDRIKKKEPKEAKAPKVKAPKVKAPKVKADGEKVERRGRKTIKVTPPELSQKGFILVHEVSEKMNVDRAKFYTIFYKYKNGDIKNEDGTPVQIEQGKDFVVDGGRIAIHQDLVERMKESLNKPRRKSKVKKTPEFSGKISLICGDRILKITKEESQKIIEILSQKSKDKLSESI